MNKLLLTLFAVVFMGQLARAQTYSSTGAVAIPDATGSGSCGTTAPATSSISVTASATTKIIDPNQVTINLNIAHTFIGDLLVELVAPDGTACILINRLGRTGVCTDFGSGNDFSAANTLSFNASFSTAIPTSPSPIPAGNYTPTGSTGYPATGTLSSFLLGKFINGNWNIRATDNSNDDVGTISSWNIVFGSTALPLNLISFTGRSFASYNNLEWSTGSEKATASFELQRSADAREYLKIASIDTKGDGNNSYAHLDNNPLSGNSFYRLKMIDKDGKFSFSNTIQIAVQQSDKAIASITPNPTKGNINVVVNNNDLLGTQGTILNLSGQTIQSFNVNTTNLEFNITPYPAGIYLIRFQSGELIKFTKQD